MNTVDILLATYNGARYLPELLASLERQTLDDWRVLVRDDGSSDGTVALLENWAERRQDRVRIIRDGRTGLGASGNFAALLEAADAPYFMLCDQDDIWLPDKINRLFRLVQQAEERSGRDAPILAHTDLVVVDDDLRRMHASFWRYQRLMKPSPECPYERLVIQNCVTGCASIGNAALRTAALPIPKEAMMHDWWLALVAGTFGEIVEEPEPTVLYRQHSSNTLGAKSWSVPRALLRFVQDPAASVRRAHFILSGTQRQATAFADRFSERLDPAAVGFFREYGSLGSNTFLNRKLFLFKHHLWFDDLIRNCAILSFI